MRILTRYILAELGKRIADIVGDFRKRIDPKGQECFRDSVGNHVGELARLVNKLNVTGDQRIEEIAGSLRQLAAVTPQSIRDSDDVRNETMARADEIRRRVEALGAV